ncbi:alpha/beta fold hydrolase [Roseomonas sp. 18066]|uniref:alpha/beta fold hydrolase n=1 Tax=Roseomonas sp. 18066 TaxID=2681412 RepID=UPI001357EEE4|nr:alpha/beta hydrolase [Roseomonas sp. 18066]
MDIDVHGSLDTPDGARLTLYRLGRRDAPPLLWGHANGFATASYPALLADLAQDHDLWAWDARGHGQSTLPEGVPVAEAVTLDRLGADAHLVAQAVRQATGAWPQGAAHSFSALAMLLAGVAWPSLTLFEPPIMTPALLERPAIREGMRQRVAATLFRRRLWDSPAQLFARLRPHPAYALIDDAALQAHATAQLRPEETGWRLRCAPETEAAIYQAVGNFLTFESLARVTVPCCFVASDTEAGDWLRGVQPLAAAACHGRAVVLARTTHFLPLENPAGAAALVRQAS